MLVTCSGHGQTDSPNPAAIRAGFTNPPSDARTRLFWRVFGPAWTRDEIDYQLELLKQAGVGGVTVFFMYPVALDSATVHNERFLSSEFLTSFEYAARKSGELGLRFSVAGGTGWPFGGPCVTPIDAAQRIKQVKLPAQDSGKPITLPFLQEGERFLAAFCGTSNISRYLDPRRGILQGADFTNPVALYVTGPTYMQVKRPAFGGEGLVLDHYSSAAARKYLETVVAPMLRAAPGQVDSVFCDSLEVYGANWTSDMPVEFERRRGYSLVADLPTLFDSASAGARELRFDFWRTLAELTEERFAQTLSDWAHRHHVNLEMEAYGTPPNPLTAARYIDVPTGEQYEWRGFSLSRLAASGAHLAGKRVVGAEAWTWLGLPNRLGDSLSDLKLAGDLHFLAGVNDLTGVDFAYSPRSAGAPGWLPYYGPVLNQNNPQWPWFDCLVDYTSRCQWLLRQGKPVADVAIYLPAEDKFADGPEDQMLLGFHLRDHFASGEKTGEFGLQTALRHRSNLIHGLLTSGFNYDGVDFFSLNRLAHIRRGHLLAGDGNYSILILSRVEGVEISALETILGFCRSGGTVILTCRVPERTYGRHDRTFMRRSERLLHEFLGDGPKDGSGWAHTYGSGRVIFVPDEEKSLIQTLSEFAPDVRTQAPEPDIGFVHRQTGSLDLYFLANVSDHSRAFEVDFRTHRGNAQVWDPMNGEVWAIPSDRTADGYQRVKLELPTRGSTFVVFGSDSPAQPKPDYQYETNELKCGWHLTFLGSSAPAARSLTELSSWTLWPDARFFSGQGTYTASFDWPHAVPRRAWLEFAQVREAAEVRINGQLAGRTWTPPYQVEITRWLKPGLNALSVTVANLPLNLFLGTPDEDLSALRAVYGNRFPAPEEKKTIREPVPSGLLGAIAIRFAAD
jgi:hypothetical protein